MTHGSLFSGIGGFDLAAEWMSWENVFHCEWNPFGQKILKYYWPDAISYSDITKTDFSIHRGEIDIVTGGFPCQPFSAAGKRKGNEDNRHLWPEMLRAIREIQPSWIVGENVLGLLNWNKGLVFHEVQTDLEAAGFITFPYVLPACGKDAPHRRDRLWIIAYSNLSRCKQSNKEIKERSSEQFNGIRFQRNVTNAEYQGLQRSELFRGLRGKREKSFDQQFVRPFCSKWEKFPSEHPVRGGNDGISEELAGITFSKHRVESIKAYGNAIVPQVAYEIFKAIEKCQTSTPQNLKPGP